MNAHFDEEHELVFRRIRVLDEEGLPHWIEVPLPGLAVAA